MGQITPQLRSVKTGYRHWCPGCRQMHIIPNTWCFDGNLAAPTFSPSVLIRGMKQKVDVAGEWTGEWERDAEGKPLPYVCHYNLTAGQIIFHGDSTHALAGQNVPLPLLPHHAIDVS